MVQPETYPRYLIDWNEDGAFDHALSNVTSVIDQVSIAHGCDVIENTQFNIPRVKSGNLELIGAEYSPNHTTQLAAQLNKPIPMKVELSANHSLECLITNARNDGRPAGSGTPVTRFSVSDEIEPLLRKPFAYYCNTALEGTDGLCSFADVLDRIGLWTGVPFSRRRSFPYPSRFNQQRFYHVGSAYEMFSEFGTSSPNNIFVITRDGAIACFDITGTGVGSKPSADKPMSQSSFKIYSATRKEDDSSIINSIRIGGNSGSGLIDTAFELEAVFSDTPGAATVSQFDKQYPGAGLYPDIISIDPDAHTRTHYPLRSDAFEIPTVETANSQISDVATIIRGPRGQLQQDFTRKTVEPGDQGISFGLIDFQVRTPWSSLEILANYSTRVTHLTFTGPVRWVRPSSTTNPLGNYDENLPYFIEEWYVLSDIGRYDSAPIYLNRISGWAFGLKMNDMFARNGMLVPINTRYRTVHRTGGQLDFNDDYTYLTSADAGDPASDSFSVNTIIDNSTRSISTNFFSSTYNAVRWRFNVRASINVDQTDRRWFFYVEQPPVPSITASAAAFTDSVEQFGVRALQVSQLAVRDIESFDIQSRLDFDPTGSYDAQYEAAFAPIAQNWADNTGYIPRPYYITELDLPLWQGGSRSEALAAFEPGNYINLNIQDDTRPVNIDKHVLCFYWELLDSQSAIPRIRLRTLDTQATPAPPPVADRALTWRMEPLTWRGEQLTWR